MSSSADLGGRCEDAEDYIGESRLSDSNLGKRSNARLAARSRPSGSSGSCGCDEPPTALGQACAPPLYAQETAPMTLYVAEQVCGWIGTVLW